MIIIWDLLSFHLKCYAAAPAQADRQLTYRGANTCTYLFTLATAPNLSQCQHTNINLQWSSHGFQLLYIPVQNITPCKSIHYKLELTCPDMPYSALVPCWDASTACSCMPWYPIPWRSSFPSNCQGVVSRGANRNPSATRAYSGCWSSSSSGRAQP